MTEANDDFIQQTVIRCGISRDAALVILEAWCDHWQSGAVFPEAYGDFLNESFRKIIAGESADEALGTKRPDHRPFDEKCAERDSRIAVLVYERCYQRDKAGKARKIPGANVTKAIEAIAIKEDVDFSVAELAWKQLGKALKSPLPPKK